MGLMIDKRATVGEGAPGCHALIVGVSAYPNLRNPGAIDLSLQPLSSAALSAQHVYRWIRNAKLAVPLASVRLLLSPAEGESLEAGAARATLDNFITDASGWRRDASGHAESMTFFYFAGHGFSLSQGEQLLVLQDFGDGIGTLLRHTVSVNNLLYGMVPVFSPDIARTQLYFIDANRDRPAALGQYQSLKPTAVFDTTIGGEDDRSTIVFYATSPDSQAYAYQHQQTFFSRALIESLEGAAAEYTEADGGRWAVSVHSLASHLPARVAQLASEAGVKQQLTVEGQLRQKVIAYLQTPPLVDVSIEIRPPDAAAAATVSMMTGDGEPVQQWGTGVTPTARVPAGLYMIDVRGESSGVPFKKRKVLTATGASANVVFEF